MSPSDASALSTVLAIVMVAIGVTIFVRWYTRRDPSERYWTAFGVVILAAGALDRSWLTFVLGAIGFVLSLFRLREPFRFPARFVRAYRRAKKVG